MRKSKYLGMTSGNWTCTHVGIARVQPTLTHYKDSLGRRIKSKSAGSKQYYYIFERPTSDGKAMKMIRLNANQATSILKGLKTVEDFSLKKESERSQQFNKKISYSFVD